MIKTSTHHRHHAVYFFISENVSPTIRRNHFALRLTPRLRRTKEDSGIDDVNMPSEVGKKCPRVI